MYFSRTTTTTHDLELAALAQSTSTFSPAPRNLSSATLNSVAPLDANQVEMKILDSLANIKARTFQLFDAKLSVFAPQVQRNSATPLGAQVFAGLTGVQSPPTTIHDCKIHFKRQSWENPYATAAPTDNDSSNSKQQHPRQQQCSTQSSNSCTDRKRRRQ